MKKLLLISSLLVLGTAAIGQVKIGTNPATLATNANLQVEGTTTAQQFVVLKNGNVGIGTSAPTLGLQVQGGVSFAGGGGGVPVNTQGLQIHWNNTALMGTPVQGMTSFLNHSGSGPGGFTFSSTSNTTFATGPVEYMRITSEGKVGIGTNNPTDKLNVVGSASITNAINTGGVLRLGSLGTGNRNSFIDLFAADNPTFNARIIRAEGVGGNLSIYNTGGGQILMNTIENQPHLTVSGTTGFVGIGRQGAVVPLDVNGVVRVLGSGLANENGTQLTFNDVQVGGVGNVISGFVNNKGTANPGTGGFLFATTSDNTAFNKVLEIDYTGNITTIGNITQNATGYFKVATGTTTQRPATPAAGMIRFNTTLNKFEGYDGTAWQLLN